MNRYEVDDAAVAMADMVFMTTAGTNAERVRAAVSAYLYSVSYASYGDDGWVVYPSFEQWQEHLKANQLHQLVQAEKEQP